jgi:cytochrome c-type biogenesis protein CcmE
MFFWTNSGCENAPGPVLGAGIAAEGGMSAFRARNKTGCFEEDSMSSTIKFVIGGLVVAVVIGALIITSFSGSTSDYLTISEVKALGPDQVRDSRVSGAIVPDSVEWSTRDLHLTFQIADASGQLDISYHGPQPDMLVDAVEAVVIGKYDRDTETFEADELLMKCPSKYEEKE